jgi:hypothetical protein
MSQHSDTKHTHTPGPWTLRMRAKPILAWDVVTTDGAVMGGVYEEANARLIAAAPELLEALEAVAQLLDNGQPIDPEHDGDWIRAAIANATGGDQ